MKKYLTTGLIISVCLSLSIASAQVTGDVAPDQASEGCTDLSYNLVYKKSKDANTNGEVSDLQYFLQDQGLLNVEPNGAFGPATLKAVKYFQKKNGFITSGYVGPMTRAKIKAISCNDGITESVGDVSSKKYTTDTNHSLISGPVISAESEKANLNLNYDSNYKESSLTTTSRVKVRAGSQDMIIMKPGHAMHSDAYVFYAKLYNDINYYGKIYVIPEDKNVIDNGDYYLLKASETSVFKIKQEYEPKRMFAGIYYVKLGYTNYASNGSGSVNVDLVKTNSVTVIGENTESQILSSSSAVVTNGPTIALGYDSSNKEVSLNTKAVIKVTAGGSNLWIKKPGNFESSEVTNYAYFQMFALSSDKGLGKGGIAFGNPDTYSELDNYSYWIIKAGESRNFDVSSNITNVKQMFAGSYHAVPSLYVVDTTKGTNTNILNTKDGNYVTIIGETSPYISGVKVNENGGITITGARLNLVDNYLQIDGFGNSMVSKFNPTNSSVTISKGYQIISNLSVGYHNLKITNSKTGDSNEYGFNVEQTVPLTPVEAHGPNYNAMSCSNTSKSGLSAGSVACYGIWDYGNEFGGDPDMCPPYGYSSSQIGCKVTTKACQSGQAVATRMVNPTSMDVNSSDIATFATNLKTSKEAVKQQIPTLWEYTCDGVVTTTPVVQLGLYKGYLGGSETPFIVKENISKTDALVNCKTSSTNNPTKSIKCTWNGIEIYSFTPLTTTSTALSTTIQPTTCSGGVVVYGIPCWAAPTTPVGTIQPTARVTPATSISATSAQLNGVANAKNMSSVHGSFRYGTADATCIGSGQDTLVSGTPSTFSGNVDTMTYKIVNNLTPNTKYYFCMEVSDGKTSASVYVRESFTTPPLPTTPSVLGASTVCVDLSRNMHRGIESSSVTTLQKFLQTKGLLSEVSGFYGDKTIEAVKDYQASIGLVPTGMVYEVTRQAIRDETCR